MFQDFNLIDDYSVEKNIALGLNLKHNPEKISEVLKQVDLEEKVKRKTNTLSGGQKQRVVIARALKKAKTLNKFIV